MDHDNLILSPTHGVNPTLAHCECCGKEYGVALLGRLKGDVKAPREALIGLCDDCQKVIDQGGVMIIEVRDGEKEKCSKNPYRTGRIVGCSKQYKERNNIQSSVCYMEHSMFQSIFGSYIKP